MPTATAASQPRSLAAFEKIDGGFARTQSGGPAGIERDLDDEPAQLVEGDAAGHSTAHPVLQVILSAQCGEDSASDENPVAVRHVWLLQDIQQHFPVNATQLRHCLVDARRIGS